MKKAIIASFTVLVALTVCGASEEEVKASAQTVPPTTSSIPAVPQAVGEEAKASVKTETAAQTADSASVAPQAVKEEELFEKQGFLTTKWCADQGMFIDCRLESVVCGEGGCYRNWEFGDAMNTELVIFVHKDLQYYKISPGTNISMAEVIEKGINKDQVTIIGKYDAASNTIVASEFKAPPPPKKSFFKGCL
jgi:hypothetical protein